MAALHNPLLLKDWNKVEISKDYGQTKQFLSDVPYSDNSFQGGCLVIVNSTTIFVAGGRSE